MSEAGICMQQASVVQNNGPYATVKFLSSIQEIYEAKYSKACGGIS